LQVHHEKEIRVMRRNVIVSLVALLALAGCEGARNNTSWSGAEKGSEIVPPLQKAETGDTAAVDSAAASSSEDKQEH
jgi:hypothetical protein